MVKKVFFITNILVMLFSYSPSQMVNKLNADSVGFFTMKKAKNAVLLKRNTEQLKVEFLSADIVRLQYVPEGQLKNNETDICIPRNENNVSFTVVESKDKISLQSTQLKVIISKATGAISYMTAGGKKLLNENALVPRMSEKVELTKTVFNDSKNKVEKTANGDLIVTEISSQQLEGTAWKEKVQFEWQDGEALFGLGSQQEDYMNLRGTMQYLYQHNLKKSVPVLMSTNGYGLLFDAGSTMIFHDDSSGSFMQMNAVNELDYYFMYGPDFDQVVSHYRTLTGKVQVMPKYIFGYIQSKERYKNPQEMDSVLTRFRTEKIPIDVIVQDWNYWKPGLWGQKKFDENIYTDPAGMIKKIHKQNAHFMLSIWPSVSGNEFTEMVAKNYVLGRGIYDAYTPASRKMYWDAYVNKNLFSNGVDAWWCDASEPIDGDWNVKGNAIANNPQSRFEINSKALYDLVGLLRANTYSLHHAQGIYQNQRLITNEKRVVNLTRSGFAGLQRYGTFVWNGDTKASWEDFAQQIPSGLNYMATGLPYWTIDAGAFFVKQKNQWFWNGAFNKGTDDLGYREFYVRNVQFCQWLPMMRSHGTDFAREPWQFGKKGEPFYESILKQIDLRYRLLPYTYSVAAMVANSDYTMTRMLAFDFRGDSNVYTIKDQFMFGPAFMACPVTKPMYYEPDSKELTGVSKTRQVYLPKHADWIDFWTGKLFKGGSTITADAPIDHIPVFVRAGSIVPMSPVQQYSSEMPDAPYEIRAYPGANGTFTIYEDEGDNYNYEQGKSSSITLNWNDKMQLLTINERKGLFSGMVKSREMRVVKVRAGIGCGVSETSQAQTVIYIGKELKIKL